MENIKTLYALHKEYQDLVDQLERIEKNNTMCPIEPGSNRKVYAVHTIELKVNFGASARVPGLAMNEAITKFILEQMYKRKAELEDILKFADQEVKSILGGKKGWK